MPTCTALIRSSSSSSSGHAASPVAGNGGSVAFVAQRAQNGISWPFRLLPGAGNNRTIREFTKELVPRAGIEHTRRRRCRRVTRRFLGRVALIDLETHEAIFTEMLQRLLGELDGHIPIRERHRFANAKARQQVAVPTSALAVLDVNRAGETPPNQSLTNSDAQWRTNEGRDQRDCAFTQSG